MIPCISQIGFIENDRRAIFGRSYAAEPDQLIKELANDEAIREADTLLLTVPNTLGLDNNVHVLKAILEHVRRGWDGGESYSVTKIIGRQPIPIFLRDGNLPFYVIAGNLEIFLSESGFSALQDIRILLILVQIIIYSKLTYKQDFHFTQPGCLPSAAWTIYVRITGYYDFTNPANLFIL